MLNRQDKLNIYGLIRSEFKQGVSYPLSKVATYLSKQGLNYQEFGYKKMKSLVQDLPEFLTLETKNVNGHAVESVLFHEFKEENPLPKSKKEAKGKHKPNPLTPLKKEEIQTLLFKQFKPGETYPLSMVSKYLVDSGVDYKGLGFSKMKSLYQAMPEVFQLKEENSNQPKITLVQTKQKTIVKKNVSSKKEKSKAIEKKKPQTSLKPQVNPKEKHVSLKKGTTSQPIIYIPRKQILSLKELTGIGTDDATLEKKLLEDYALAKENGTITRKDNADVFTTSFQTLSKEKIIGAVMKSDAKTDYDYFFNYLGPDKEKPKDYLNDRVHFEAYDKDILSLASLAKKEDWCYHGSKDKLIILKIYLQYTFYQVVKQNKLALSLDGRYEAFHTGLVTSNYEDIYGVLMKAEDKNIHEPYIFLGFTIAGNQGYGKILVSQFNPLPKKATYFTSIQDLFFDPDREIITDYHHIILDNLDRLPLSFLETMTTAFPEEAKIIAEIKKTDVPYRREHLFERLERHVEKNDPLFNLLTMSLITAIEKAKRMVRYDYRMALPSLYQTRDALSLMLPLEFEKGKGVQAVLLIEKMQSGNYQGQTILTLKMCYVNARLIGPLDTTFLDPKKIED